jgi:hypothetical protein
MEMEPMAIVTEISWDDMLDGKHIPENPARKAWREAVAEIADKAHEKLPECNGRIDSAVKIVLAGDVELLSDGTAKVTSQSNGSTAYHVVNGHCDCKDFAKAPHNFCKHRLSAAIVRRAQELTTAKLADTNGQAEAPSQPPAESPQRQPQGEAVSTLLEAPLPEAPASANVHVTLAGRKVQVTLRDSDEERLLARLEKLLQRFPAEEEPEQTQPEGWCAKHGVQMKERKGKYGPFYSHMTANGWCNSK